MCQHVRGQCGRSNEPGDRQTDVGLRVLRGGPSALSRFSCPRRRYRDSSFNEHPLVDEREAREGERRRGNGGTGRQTRKTIVHEDPCQIGQPRWSVGGMPDEHRWLPAVRGLLSGSSVGDRWFEAIGLEEARPPESVQPGSGDGRSGTLGHGAQPRRLQNRFHSSAWPQGGLEATHCWKSTLLPRPLAASIQVTKFSYTLYTCASAVDYETGPSRHRRINWKLVLYHGAKFFFGNIFDLFGNIFDHAR